MGRRGACRGNPASAGGFTPPERALGVRGRSPRGKHRLAVVLALSFGASIGGEADADVRDLLALADRIAHEVSGLRGLRIQRPIRRGVLDRDAILARIQALVAEQYSPDDIRREGDVLKRLGLVPPDMQYGDTVFALLREQVAGFYDPRADRLFIASWLPASLQEPTLAHEITHALQEQHFRIGDLLRRRPGESDRQAAVSALCEGDGVATMVDWLLRATGRDFTTMPDLSSQIRAQAAGTGQPLLRGAPRVLREALLFPYVEGTSFVRALKIRGGWAAVNAAFASPPQSTEQVLHPERYTAGEAPAPVASPETPTLAAEYRAVHRDTMGELALRLYLEERVPEQARAAAEGWGGDQSVLWERPRTDGAASRVEDLALVARIRWDTETDAIDFVRAAELALERRFPRCNRLAITDGFGRRLDATLASGMRRRGAEIAWAEGVPSAQLDAVLTEALRGPAPAP